MWLPAAAICCYPVAVPGVRLADGAAALHTDRCHSLGSLGSATGGGRLASQIFTGFASSNQYPLIKKQPSRLG